MHPALSTVPGPRGLPLFGNVLELWRDPLEMLLEGVREHGDLVRFKLGPIEFFLVNNPDDAQHVLTKNHSNYRKSRSYDGLKLLLGEGLLTSEGEFWRRQRKLAQPAFHFQKLQSLADDMIDCTAAMLDRWDTEAAAGPFDLHKEMMRLTFRIVGQTLFSTNIETEAREVGEALTAALHFANRYAESPFRLPLWLPTPEGFAFQRARSRLDALVYGIIEKRRHSGADPGDLLSMLMATTDESGTERMSDRHLRDEIMTLTLAGHETTANALSFTWYLLSKHPDVARKLNQELEQVLGGRTPSFADLGRLEYTERVLQESMRLYPPAWIIERQSLESDELSGCHVPAGVIVAVSPYILHRHPKHWENPEGFDPDRFAPERASGRARHAYLPFGDGPRVCIGKAFAMMEAKLVLAMVAQRYRFDLVQGHRLELVTSITLRSKHGVRVWRHRRASLPESRTAFVA